jgi:cell division protein FtsL
MINRKHNKYRRSGRYAHFRENRYIRIVGIIMVVVMVASVYIYQRVWTRNLSEEIDELQKQNDRTREHLVALKSDWIATSSISNVEIRLEELDLKLKPTRPSQNFTLRPDAGREPSRYAGLVKALESLKGSISLVSNEADARILFDEE